MRAAGIGRIRETLAAGGVSVGSWIQIPNASVAEVMGDAGYDWVAIDMEHGSMSVSQLPDLFRALELGNTLPLVRVAEGTARECKQALDAGAAGIIAPMIETAEQLASVRDACRWPPGGTRGVGFSRGNLFGKRFDEYREEAQAPLLIAMIEHVRAIENLDRILGVSGVDAVLIGPYDLSASMGLTAQFDHPTFTSAIAEVLAASKRRGVAAGVHVVEPDAAQLRKRIAEGYRFLAYSIDAVFLQTVSRRPQS